MSKLRLLISTSLRNQLSLAHGARRSWPKIFWVLAITGLVALGMHPVFSFLWEVAGDLQQAGFLDLLLLPAVLLSSVVSFLTGIYVAPGQLFMCTDYDLLLSLPLRTSTVLMSKLSSQLLSNLMFTLLLSLPLLMIYGLKSGAGPVFYLFALVSLPFIPLVPLTLAALLAAIIARIAARFERSNTVLTLLTFALLVAPMIGYGLSKDSRPSLGASLDDALRPIETWYPPAGLYLDALRAPSLVSLILFMVVSAGVFILFCLVFARFFKAIYSSLSASPARADYAFKELAAATVPQALYIRELRGCLFRPAYVLNTFACMVMLMITALGAACLGDARLAALKSLFPKAWFVPLLMLLAIILTITATTTSSSISLEGRSLWILKSAPISPLSIFKAKLFLNLGVTLPCLAITSALLAIGLRLDRLHWLLVLAVPSAYALFIAMAGLLINLQFTLLEGKNPTAVVKQSLSVLLTFLVGLVATGMPISIYEYWLAGRVAYELYSTLVGAVLLVMTALLWRVLKIKGVVWFAKL